MDGWSVDAPVASDHDETRHKHHYKHLLSQLSIAILRPMHTSAYWKKTRDLRGSSQILFKAGRQCCAHP